MTSRKPWSKTIEAHGVRIRLYQGAKGHIYRALVVGRTVSANGKERPVEDRKSLGHPDLKRAEQQARALAAAIAEQRLTGRTPGTLTLGELFGQYRQHRLPNLKPPRRREAEARMAMFLDAWGRDQRVVDVSQDHIDAYVRKRQALEVLAPVFKPDVNGKRRRGYREPQRPRDGALHGELSWLSTAFNWAVGRSVNGRELLAYNPIQKRKCTWPKELNPRRPVAAHARFLATMEHVDTVDPAGRLRCVLALARWTGRRESAICQLRASDLLLSESRVRAALAAEGMDERLVEHMPRGAIRWAAETDKQGLRFITPISRTARDAIDFYLRKDPRMGDVPLFPAPQRKTDSDGNSFEVSISRDLAAKWLIRAERLAEQPKLVGGVFHPYRRLWATERKHLADADVAAAGGWKDTRALKTSYQAADPASILGVVEHT